MTMETTGPKPKSLNGESYTPAIYALSIHFQCSRLGYQVPQQPAVLSQATLQGSALFSVLRDTLYKLPGCSWGQ